MHICAVTPSYIPLHGGAEIGLHQILSRLKSVTDHKLSVITGTVDPQLSSIETIEGIQIFRYLRTKLWLKWYAPTLQAFLTVPRLLDKLKPDIIVISYLLPAGLAAWAYAKLHKIPVVLVLGGNDIYDPFIGPSLPLRKWMKWVIHRTPTIVGFSGWASTLLIQDYGVNPDTIMTIPFGIDTTLFHPDNNGKLIRDQYKISDDTTLLFALQRLDTRKGITVLIDALKIFRENNPDKTVHLIIGGKGPERQKIENHIRSTGVDAVITLCGFIPDEEKPYYYAAADIFLLHSYHEGLGIVLAEASATGIPSISTSAGGTDDIIKNGKTGLLVPAGEPLLFSEALYRLIQSTELRNSMGMAARIYVEHNLSLEIISQRYVQVIETAQPPL